MGWGEGSWCLTGQSFGLGVDGSLEMVVVMTAPSVKAPNMTELYT